MTGQLMLAVDDLALLPAQVRDVVAADPRWVVGRLGQVETRTRLRGQGEDRLEGLAVRGGPLTWTGVVALRVARGQTGNCSGVPTGSREDGR